MTTSNDKNTATLIHLSALSQYFIPFGNFIFPVIIWSALKDKSSYIDAQGRQSINFQLSLFLYSLVLAIAAIIIFIMCFLKGTELSYVSTHGGFIADKFDFENISGMIVAGLIIVVLFIFFKIIEFFLIIYAAVKTSNGDAYQYPFTINFLKNTIANPEENQIKESSTPES